MNLNFIEQIRKEYRGSEWPQFLSAVTIKGLRGWTGQRVPFDYPVTAVVGENGTGKSTVLRAAACAYDGRGRERYFPSGFFAETPWDTFANVEITYEVREGTKARSFALKKPSSRWSYPDSMPARDVFFLDISRTLPIDSSIGYGKIAKRAIAESGTEQLPDEFRKKLSHVMGYPYDDARFALTTADKRREVGVVRRNFGEVSQFHQGAGEDATLDLMRVLSKVPKYALLIIDEVESSLHPAAQRRLVNVLLELSKKQRCQVILSTHSPFVLDELPEEARVVLLASDHGSSVVLGPSVEFALTRIDEVRHPELHVFVEDRVAEYFLRAILMATATGPDLYRRILVAPVGSASVVRTMGKLVSELALPYNSIAVLDGDQDTAPGCLVLPRARTGNAGDSAPERMVYLDLKTKGWANLAHRFGMGAGTLFSELDDVITNPRHHEWNAAIGDKLNISKTSVWETMVQEWVRECAPAAELERVATEVKDAIARGKPRRGHR